MLKVKISTVVTVGLIILALVFAALGFTSATNLATSPALVATFMMVSAAFFAALAIRGLRRKEMWQRFLGVAAVVAALYMLAMAILYFQTLNAMQSVPYI